MMVAPWREARGCSRWHGPLPAAPQWAAEDSGTRPPQKTSKLQLGSTDGNLIYGRSPGPCRGTRGQERECGDMMGHHVGLWEGWSHGLWPPNQAVTALTLATQPLLRPWHQ